jgi:OPA family glycerol-3-phosphate transporter-like MFS transporter
LRISSDEETIVREPSETAAADAARQRYWQNRTLVLLFVGYAGYYFCRVFFASIKPVLIEQYHSQGINKVTLGLITTVGTFCYAFGKFFNTVLCDFIGGRRMFLFGMAGAALCTIFFGLSSGLTFFLLAWALNRLVQSMGWGGLVKITSHWFSYEQYGSVMALLCLNFVLGDGGAKLLYGWLLDRGVGWRSLCFAAAGILLLIWVWSLLRLKDGPREVGLEEPPTNPRNLYAERGSESRNKSLRELLMPFFKSPAFWIILILSFGLTLIRDTFGEWLPLYLTEVGHLSAGKASLWAALFPFFGAVSIVVVGYGSDRFLGRRRGGLMAVLLAVATFVLFAMSRITTAGNAALPTALAAAVALLTIGPYSFLSGAIALDLGGRRGSATASGMIDGVGYLSGGLSGLGVGALAERQGWGAAFGMLAGTCVLMTLAAVVYWRRCEERPAPIVEASAGIRETESV